MTINPRRAALTKPRASLTDWQEVRSTNRFCQQREDAKRLIRYALDPCRPTKVSVFIGGISGVGKSTWIRDELRAQGREAHCPAVYTFRDIEQALYDAERLKQPLWIDEADGLFSTALKVNVLKRATDVGGGRELSMEVKLDGDEDVEELDDE
jgi:hypothetical protein